MLIALPCCFNCHACTCTVLLYWCTYGRKPLSLLVGSSLVLVGEDREELGDNFCTKHYVAIATKLFNDFCYMMECM